MGASGEGCGIEAAGQGETLSLSLEVYWFSGPRSRLYRWRVRDSEGNEVVRSVQMFSTHHEAVAAYRDFLENAPGGFA